MTIVETRSGKVLGLELEGVHVFRGIPYAAPPVGERRWQPPIAEQPWAGVRDATEFGPQSAQSEFALTKMLGAAQPPCSEDSLYLNVWTPGCDDARRPVMVWIHGGAFLWGAGDTPWYDGTRFASNDVVLVTINYRLGPFGFLYLGDLLGERFAGSGNLGLLDQIAALEWVRDCVDAFGGDPNRVTIFGESAGGASVATLLGAPAARGLFRGAIPQSGAASWTTTRDQATAVAQGVLDRVGVAAGDVSGALAVPTDALIGALPSFREDTVNTLPFQPVVDGVVLPQPPLATIAAGNAAGVHVLAGTNRHEMTLFMLADPAFGRLTDDLVRERVRRVAGHDGDQSDAVVRGYRERRPEASPQDLWLDLATDSVFRIPALRLLEAQHPHAPVWSYLFTWETPVFGGLLRSTHALEIPFVFDNLTRGRAEILTGTGGERAGLARAMHRAWTAFARSGDPNHDGLPAWPRYDLNRRPTMRFDAAPEVLDDPAGDDRRQMEAALGV
ncbi:MAG TPA: carboxylesterase/lipase family protein [Acidimicrobiia bacterium]|nr:carboxylesterase/lipase family protein [Acidimicrobiia bacterium]